MLPLPMLPLLLMLPALPTLALALALDMAIVETRPLAAPMLTPETIRVPAPTPDFFTYGGGGRKVTSTPLPPTTSPETVPQREPLGTCGRPPLAR